MQHPNTPRKGISLSLSKRTGQQFSPKYESHQKNPQQLFKPGSERRNSMGKLSNQKMNQTFDAYFISNTASVRKSVPNQIHRQKFFSTSQQEILNNSSSNQNSNFTIAFPIKVAATNQPKQHPCVIYRMETNQNCNKVAYGQNNQRAQNNFLGQSKVQKVGVNQYLISRSESQQQRIVKQKKMRLQQMQRNLQEVNKQLANQAIAMQAHHQQKPNILIKLDQSNQSRNQNSTPRVTFSQNPFSNHMQIFKPNDLNRYQHNKKLPIRSIQQQNKVFSSNHSFNPFPVQNVFVPSVIVTSQNQNYQIKVVDPKEDKVQTQRSFIRNLYSTTNLRTPLAPIEQNQIKQFDANSTPLNKETKKPEVNDIGVETPHQFKVGFDKCSVNSIVNQSSQKKRGKIKRKLRGDRLMQIENRLNEIIKKVNNY